MNGRFIVLEGLDGSGKTTVINRLKADFPDYVYTREPGGSVFGEMMRLVLLDTQSKNVPAMPILLGFMSGRASHFEELVRPAVLSGKTVISDRFDGSTFAFQLHGQQNTDLEKMFWYLRGEILGSAEKVCQPQYIFLRLDKETAHTRRQKRGDKQNHFDLQTEEFHDRVRLSYEKFFDTIQSKESGAHRVVDASQSIDEVYEEIKKILNTV